MAAAISSALRCPVLYPKNESKQTQLVKTVEKTSSWAFRVLFESPSIAPLDDPDSRPVIFDPTNNRFWVVLSDKADLFIGEGRQRKVYFGVSDRFELTAIEHVPLTTSEAKEAFKQEIEVRELVNKVNGAVKMIYAAMSSTKGVIVAPYYKQPDLDRCIFSNEYLILSPDQLRLYMEELLLTLSQIHEMGIVHRDIKPENVFRDGGHLFLGDFGMAQLNGRVIMGTGTPAYIAPERWPKREDEEVPEATSASDVWSLGVVFYIMITGLEPPWYNYENLYQIRKMITTDGSGRLIALLRLYSPKQEEQLNVDQIIENGSPHPEYIGEERRAHLQEIFENVSKARGRYRRELLVLIEAMVDPNPEARFTAKQALEWLKAI